MTPLVLKEGKAVTFLPDASGASANAVGVVQSIKDRTATIDLLCGITISTQKGSTVQS